MDIFTSRRFEDIDLARLDSVPDIAAVDFERELASIRSGFTTRWEAFRAARPDLGLSAIDVLLIEGTPLLILMQEIAYRHILLKQTYNEAVRAVMLASTWGAYLEHRAAEFGLLRRVIVPADPATGAAAVMESDDELRRRRQLAIEAITNAGSYGAYVWFAESAHPQIKQAVAYGPESGLVAPGQVQVVVLDRRGSGSPDGQVLGAVEAILSPKTRRPLTDQPAFVVGAAITEYQVAGVIRVLPGPGITEILGRANARVAQYVADRHRIGASVEVDGLRSAMLVVAPDGRALVEDVVLTAPAAPIRPGLTGAGFCTSITITAQTIDGEAS